MGENIEVKVVEDIEDVKHLFIELQERDENGLACAPKNTFYAFAEKLIPLEALNIPSDNAPNGKIILQLTIPAATTLVIPKLKVGADGEQTISLGYGIDLASVIDVDHYYLNTKQMWDSISDGQIPIMVIRNLTENPSEVFVYAKTGTIMGVANNPAAGARNYMATMLYFTIP